MWLVSAWTYGIKHQLNLNWDYYVLASPSGLVMYSSFLSMCLFCAVKRSVFLFQGWAVS